MVFAIFIFAVGHVAHKETANDNSDKSESMGKKDIQRDELNHKKNIINSISIYISNAQGLVKNADKKKRTPHEVPPRKNELNGCPLLK